MDIQDFLAEDTFHPVGYQVTALMGIGEVTDQKGLGEVCSADYLVTMSLTIIMIPGILNIPQRTTEGIPLSKLIPFLTKSHQTYMTLLGGHASHHLSPRGLLTGLMTT